MARRNNYYGINPATGEPFKAQWEVIYQYLREKRGRKITSGQAINDFGFTRLSAIIYTIRERTGITPARRSIDVPTRYGGLVSVTEYWLEMEEGK